MKVAVIDIGTNTFNLLIAEKKSDQLALVHVEKVFVFLGKGGINKNQIQPDAIQRGLQTLKEFKETADSFQVKEVIAIATSAVRNAQNGKKFTDLVFEATQIQIQTIEGDREAELIYKGAREATDFGEKPVLLMDVGGGSTEFIIADRNKIYWKKSFEVGASRLFEKFHQNDPITTPEIKNIEAYLKDFLAPLMEKAKEYNITTLIGSAGAFTSFAKIVANRIKEANKLVKTSEYKFELSEFYSVNDYILKTKLNERYTIKGLVKERAPMIVVGTVLVNFVLQDLNISDFKLARYALKEGVASEYFTNA